MEPVTRLSAVRGVRKKPLNCIRNVAMKFERQTAKLYYSDFFLSQTQARIVKVGPDFIELDATVAYPEGGGQDADTGTIELDDGRSLRFIWTKRMYAHASGLATFPDVQLGGVIWHMIDPAQQALLPSITPGSSVTVRIDIERRARLSLSHTASHLLYLSVGQHRPEAIQDTLGCHLKTDGARFDFSINTRFTAEDLARIEATANAYVQRNVAITVSAHPQACDERLWHCEDQTMPGGGKHLESTGAIGPLTIRRKGLGAGKERISCTFAQASPDLLPYHS